MADRCSVCDPTCRLVEGDGPVPCDWLFLGEKPGYTEDKYGKPFIGDTGREFNHNYLQLAGLGREDIRITNTVHCRLGNSNSKPTTEQVTACANHHLPREVNECSPNVIVLMGATACSLVPSIELDKEHGIPRQIESADSEFFGGWAGWVIPMFHPAAGLHDTGMMIPLLDDFERIKEWRNGKYNPPSGNRECDYRIVDSERDLRDYIASGVDGAPGCDTEDDNGRAWSVQFSNRAGSGRLIRAERRDLLEYLFKVYAADGFIFHHAAHDLRILETLGIRVSKWRDTMQEAYHLGNLPQGLKALGYRLLGVKMQSYEDVVEPHSRKVLIKWLTQEWAECEPERIETQLKTKLTVTWKPRPLERGLKRILSHSHKPTYDLWEQTQSLGVSGSPHISISHVPKGISTRYACQDADVTLQVAAKLSQMRNSLVNGDWHIDEDDRDR